MKKRFSVFLGLLLFLTACGSDDATKTDLALVIGNHGNMNQLTMERLLNDELVEDTAKNGGEVTIFSVEGTPRKVSELRVAEISGGKTKGRIKRNRNELLKSIRAYHDETKATTPETDLYSALEKAKNSFTDGRKHRMVIMDTMLPTSGDEINFLTGGYLQADPAEAMKILEEDKAILDLAGVEILIIGLGETAEPQSKLSPKEKANLRTFWDMYFEKSGAKVSIKEVDETTPHLVNDYPAVSPIPVLSREEKSLKPAFGLSDAPIVFDEERIAFQPNTSELVNETAAKEELANIVELVKPTSIKLLVIGTTANHGNDTDQLRLSKERAEKIAQLMVSGGVSQQQLVAIGLGSKEDPWHVEERTAAGEWLENNAKANRKVVLVSTDSTIPEVVRLRERKGV